METQPLHPRVGVAVYILKDGKFIMGQRKGKHGPGFWAPPGGHLEMGESIEECAAREAMEETGVAVSNIRFGALTNDVFGPDKHYITISMIADWSAGEPQLLEPDKCEEWRWCTWEDLPSPLFLPLENLQKQGFSPFN